MKFIALTFVLAGMLGAQGQPFRGESLTPPTPADMVQRQVDHLTKFFGLTSSQVTDVTKFLTTEQTCLQSNSTNLQSAREGLVTAIKTPGSNIATAVSTLSSLQAADETCRATAAAGIYADLTSTQQTKLGNGLGLLMGGGGGPRFGPPQGR